MAFNLICYFFQHLWKEWEYTSLRSCQQLRVCQRCKKEEYRLQEHKWDKSCKFQLNSGPLLNHYFS